MVIELHPRQGRVNDSLWMTATPAAYSSCKQRCQLSVKIEQKASRTCNTRADSMCKPDEDYLKQNSSTK